jgi:Fe-S oxidoreductase/FAD/FMN-containing dehydrogenase
MLAKEEEQELLDIFTERVAFHDTERMLYSSDVSNLPEFVRKRINTNPDAVVQPNSPNELGALVDLAVKYKTPLIPRGSGTAGYGGAVPARGGIVVDLYRLSRIIDINEGQKTVTVESGAILADIEKELRGHGLALRLYPSSVISATAGGWLANGGGVGIGSFEYGRLKDNVLEVNLVTPKGVRKLAGDDLRFVDGMAGTTGLISQMTLMMREADEDIPVLGAFHGLDDLLGAFGEIKQQKLALWHVGYKDPSHIRLSREAVAKQAERSHLHGNEKKPGLPEDKILAIFVYPESRHAGVADRLLNIIQGHGGEVLDAELAGLEWEERFYPMRLKALGPSMIQSEATIPTEKLPAFARNIGQRIKGVTFDGTLINQGKETAILTYALEDERRRGFTLAYPTNLTAIEEARKLGGRAYAIGMYLTDEAGKVFGENTLRKIYDFKKEVDPDGIMNPGKVFPATLDREPSTKKISRLVKMAKRGSGALKAIDRLFGGKTARETLDSKTKLAELPFARETAWDAFACVGCGYCRNECPQFSAIGWESASPRGKFHLLREYLKGNVKLDKRMAEMFFACTTCHQCDEICQVKSRIEEDWTWVAKPAILKEGFQPPLVFQRQAHHILIEHNPGGDSQDQRKAWMTPDLKYSEEGEIGYWAGCAVSYTYLLRNLPINAFRVLNKAGIEPVYLGSDEWCCGGAIFNVGCLDELTEIVRHNLNELKRRGVKTIITSCSSCWYNLAVMYPLIARRLNMDFDLTIKHITETVSDLIEEGRIKCEKPVELEVTYHDPCHIGRGGGIYEPPRKIMASIPGLELVEMPRNREHSACCSKHIMRYPRLGNIINSSRTNEAAQTGASAIICSCSTCENNLRQGAGEAGISMEVIDIMDLVAESIGLPRVSVSKLSRLLRSKK